MNLSENKAKTLISSSMVIFGTIGIVRRYIPLSSSIIAFSRGMIGAIVLLVFILLTRRRISWKNIRLNLVFILASGISLGFNWILLFEAYQYTTVATATLCYYMAPMIVILVSPVLLKEKLTSKKLACVAVALVGMVLVSGILETGLNGTNELKGILLGLGAASFYANIVILNQKIHDISAYDKTIMQLATAAFVMIPYIFLTEDISTIQFTPQIVFMLLIIGVIHTGIAYAMYFGSMDGVKAQTVALLGYIDPIVAIILSALFLHETIGVDTIVGAILVLGATIISELNLKQTLRGE